MSMVTLSRQQVRQIDHRAVEQYGMSSLVLMENAGRGVADRMVQLGIRGPVTICCGKGNNAGDGFVLARHLDLRGLAVQVLVWASPQNLEQDAAFNYEILSRTRVPIQLLGPPANPIPDSKLLDSADWVVDAILGTGVHGDPRPPLDEVIDWLNDTPARRLAVDVPSGLDCDSGQASRHTFQADHTCTFVAAKPGFFLGDGPQYTGKIHVLDIGAPGELVEASVKGLSMSEE